MRANNREEEEEEEEKEEEEGREAVSPWLYLFIKSLAALLTPLRWPRGKRSPPALCARTFTVIVS